MKAAQGATGYLPPPLQPVGRTKVHWGGRDLLYFGGCDYFRLSTHPAVRSVVRRSLSTLGLNVAASRLTTGNHALHLELEARLAQFFEVEAAALVPNGYLSNLAAAQALEGQFTCALLDERAHPSLVDASLALGCPVSRFRHRDPEDLARLLRALPHPSSPLILTDGVFGQDGALAPLGEYLELLPKDGRILVDDAHGVGVLGRYAKGTAQHFGVPVRRLVQCATLSKAFGVHGGVILGTRRLIEAVQRRSRVFAGSTPLPLPLAAGALAALVLVATDLKMRQRLAHSTALVKAALPTFGVAVHDNPAPIVSLEPKSTQQAARLERSLLAQRIYPSFIRYPGGPEAGFFRFAISSEHTPRELGRLVAGVACGL